MIACRFFSSLFFCTHFFPLSSLFLFFFDGNIRTESRKIIVTLSLVLLNIERVLLIIIARGCRVFSILENLCVQFHDARRLCCCSDFEEGCWWNGILLCIGANGRCKWKKMVRISLEIELFLHIAFVKELWVRIYQ